MSDRREIEAPWDGFPACPCGHADCEGLKLQRRGHVVRCICISCRNSRNVKRGKRGQATTHKNLGLTGFTAGNEEAGQFAQLTVRPEVKAGQQIPKSFTKFVSSEWFRHALSQSERSIPVGIDAKPAVSINGRWLVVDLRPHQKSDSPAS